MAATPIYQEYIGAMPTAKGRIALSAEAVTGKLKKRITAKNKKILHQKQFNCKI